MESLFVILEWGEALAFWAWCHCNVSIVEERFQWCRAKNLMHYGSKFLIICTHGEKGKSYLQVY